MLPIPLTPLPPSPPAPLPPSVIPVPPPEDMHVLSELNEMVNGGLRDKVRVCGVGGIMNVGGCVCGGGGHERGLAGQVCVCGGGVSYFMFHL